MDTKRILNIIIASPGDVVIERKIVREVCLGLNETDLLHHLGVSIHTSMWEDVFHSDESQKTIKSRIADECDILVCIFYRRFYTRSGRVEAENLNKFLLAYDSWKSMKKPFVMFYFKKDMPLSEDLNASEASEISDVKAKILKENILFTNEFTAPYEFCEKIYDHIENWIKDNTNKH
ncbi:MAG: hypothetical protein AB1499_07615 [Nitrospirota bacterium]